MENKATAVIGVLLLLCIALLWWGNEQKNDALERAEALEEEAALSQALVDSAAAVAAALTAQAQVADSMVEAVRDSAEVAVAQARGRLVIQRDTLEVIIRDTVALRVIDQRDSIFEGIIAQKDSIIVAQDSAISFWRASSVAKDSVIVGMARTDSLRALVNDELRGHIRALDRRKWYERGAAVAVLGCALLCR